MLYILYLVVFCRLRTDLVHMEQLMTVKNLRYNLQVKSDAGPNSEQIQIQVMMSY